MYFVIKGALIQRKMEFDLKCFINLIVYDHDFCQTFSLTRMLIILYHWFILFSRCIVS